MDFISAGPGMATIALLLIGFSVGVCGGFFGVGGAFIVTPALNVLGFPMVYAIGTDLAHMAGKSVIATLRHRRAKHIDSRAAALLMVGTFPGVKLGAQTILALEKIGATDFYVRSVYVVLLLTLGTLMLRETIRKKKDGCNQRRFPGALRIPPMISLPTSGVKAVSVWLVIAIGLLTGFLASFLGVGGGFIRMPALLYLLGLPAKIAVGTDLVEVVFSGAYGSYLYGRTGHVDIVAALVMLVGASAGSHIGAVATQYVDNSRIKKLFAVTILGSGIAVAMKQAHLNTVAAVVLFGLGLCMTTTIIWNLVRCLSDADCRAERRQDVEGTL